MGKLAVVFLLIVVLASNAYAFDWDRFERRAYTVLEFTYIGAVSMDVGTTIARERAGIPEFNPIARPLLETHEGLFIAGAVVYCGGVTFGMRKLRGLGDKGKGHKKGIKVISWIVLVFPVIYHSMAINANLRIFRRL